MYVHYGQDLMREKTERFEMRVPTSFLASVDEWRRKQPDLPGRAEAIRRLVSLGLTRTTVKTKTERGGRTVASIDAAKSTGPRNDQSVKGQPERRRRLTRVSTEKT
jgi:hypothetical protein